MKTSIKLLRSLLILTLTLISLSVCSQNSEYNIKNLLDKKWSLNGMTDKTDEEVYDYRIITTTITDNSGSTITFKSEYYLCDSIETSFDQSKLGNSLSGKYLIKRPFKDSKSNPKQPQTVTILEIKELGPNHLVLRNIKQQNLLEFTSK